MLGDVCGILTADSSDFLETTHAVHKICRTTNKYRDDATNLRNHISRFEPELTSATRRIHVSSLLRLRTEISHINTGIEIMQLFTL